MKVTEAIESIKSQLNTLSKMREGPLSGRQEEKILKILKWQDKVIAALENNGTQYNKSFVANC